MRQKLIELREKHGFTQEEVAKMVGVSRSFYGLIETGARNPTFGLAKKIAKVFGTDAEALFSALDSFRMKPDTPAAALDPTGTEEGR